MLAADYPFLDLMWTMLMFFLWIMWFWLLFTVFADIFRRHDISGWVKTAWLVFAILLPFLGVFVYLITQNVGMTERNLAARARSASSSTAMSARRPMPAVRRPRSRRQSTSWTAVRSPRPSSTRSSRRRWRSARRRRWRPRHQS